MQPFSIAKFFLMRPDYFENCISRPYKGNIIAVYEYLWWAVLCPRTALKESKSII